MNDKTGFALLREPFPEHQINKLPKPYKADSPKGRCGECGGWHGLPAAHLDYVGHAALTDRLLQADPEWTWDFVATDPTTGAPIFDQNGGLWIRLTVCGVTRLGYGDAQGKKGGNAVKEAIGDALRNAGMRFGAALDLWHKGDLHDAEEQRGAETAPDDGTSARTPSEWLGEVAETKDVDALRALYDEALAAFSGSIPDRLMQAINARKKELQAPAGGDDAGPATTATPPAGPEPATAPAEDDYEARAAAEFDAAAERGEA